MKRRGVQLSPGTGKPEQIATVLEHEIRSGVLASATACKAGTACPALFRQPQHIRKGSRNCPAAG
jgi:GntR family transcriptional regulator